MTNDAFLTQQMFLFSVQSVSDYINISVAFPQLLSLYTVNDVIESEDEHKIKILKILLKLNTVTIQ